MQPEKDRYAEFCEFRGETSRRLDSLEDRMNKIDRSIESFKTDVRKDLKIMNNKNNRIWGAISLAGFILAPIIAVLVAKWILGAGR